MFYRYSQHLILSRVRLKRLVILALILPSSPFDFALMVLQGPQVWLTFLGHMTIVRVDHLP
jgi:hypothetical protein